MQLVGGTFHCSCVRRGRGQEFPIFWLSASDIMNVKRCCPRICYKVHSTLSDAEMCNYTAPQHFCWHTSTAFERSQLDFYTTKTCGYFKFQGAFGSGREGLFMTMSLSEQFTSLQYLQRFFYQLLGFCYLKHYVFPKI